jgi:hypothetical protein
VWQNIVYKQNRGLIIGGPISSILADYVTTDVLNDSLYELGHTPTIVKKYVDDILVIIDKEKVEQLFVLLNNYNRSIKFTLEVEDDKKLPYLDLLLHRRPNCLEMSLFQKPTSKNRLLHYNSAHPKHQRVGMAYGYISRILNITSNSFKKQSIETIHQVLNMNGYPRKLINKLILKFNNRTEQNHTTPQPIGKTKFRSLMYTPVLSENLNSMFRRNNTELQIGLKPLRTLDKICNSNRQNLEKESKHGVVYQFNCNDCEKIYIGQTGQKLINRINQHKNDVKTQPINLKTRKRKKK